MRKLFAVGALAVLLSAPAAQAADDTGFVLGVRAAYGWPLGDIGRSEGSDADDAFDDFVDRAIPLWAELNYRFGPSLELGGYFSYAFVNTTDDFGGNDGSDLRLGLQLNYIFTPGAAMSPWIGVGGGWEWLSVDDSVPGDLGEADDFLDASIDGWDLMVQGGVDFALGDRMTIGPFAAVTFGQFGDIEIDDESTNIDDKAFHEWIQVGLRATFF